MTGFGSLEIVHFGDRELTNAKEDRKQLTSVLNKPGSKLRANVED